MSRDQKPQSRGGRRRLADFADRANPRLAHHFERWAEDIPRQGRTPTPFDLYTLVAELTLAGGKRLRPALAYHGALCFDHGLPASGLLDAALALEVLQTSLLIHDDIMDRDALRRGVPTIHTCMTEQLGDAHLGNSIAILAGNLALALAQRLLGEADIPLERASAATRQLVLIQQEVICGQHYDLVGGVPPSTVQALKTTSYTTRGPLRFGAALASARPSQVALLDAYAIPLGRAFQTRDDLLGTFGHPKVLGKAVGADLREGKNTDIVRLALERADDDRRRAIQSVLGDRQASDDAVAAAVAAIEQLGVRRELEALVDELTETAVAALEGSGFRAEGLDFLIDVAHLLARRQH
jgi:geranylgeranyl diphosphate synthase type I